jgi:hypothetical protein
LESQRKRWLNNVEDDMKKMDVRSWRKIAKNKNGWKFILRSPGSCMDSRAGGERERGRGEGERGRERGERERGIVEMHVSTPFYRKLKFSLRWFFFFLPKMCV